MLFADAGWIENLLREISLFLCQIVYKFMVYLYELFEVVGTADVITSDSINVVYTRIGLILGIYMMFRVILAFIQMLINPDNISDKEKGVGNLAKKAIIVVALMGVTPYIFEKAFDIQNFIVGVDSKSNVIAKIVFPEKVVSSGSFGRSLSAYLFTSFYRYDDQYTGNDCPLLHQQGDTTLLYNTIVANGGSVGVARLCLNDDEGFIVYDEDGNSQGKYSSTFTVGGDDSLEYYKIDFTWNGIFAFLVGGFTCYVLLTYTLYVGARVIQLAFFRIIAPMAILSYLSPKKDTMFEKWIKMCGTTYVDLFIRMAIIYFVVFAVDLIMGSGNGIALTREYDHEWIVNIVMIVALLLFAKKAPELLKELFPSSGVGSLGFGLKSPKGLLGAMAGGQQLWNATKRTAGFGMGALAGGAIGFLGGRGAGRVSGLFGGIGRGAFNGAKKGGLWSNLKGVGTKQAQVNKQKIDWQNNNSTWRGRMSQRMANAFGTVGAAEGFENQMAEYDKELNNLNARASAYKEASGSVGKMEDRATSQLDTKTFKEGQIYQKSLQQRRRNYKAISEALSNGDYVTAQSLINTEKERIKKVRNDWAANEVEYGTVSREYNDLKSRGITSGTHFEAVEGRYKELDSMKRAYEVSIDKENSGKYDDYNKIEKISKALDNEAKISTMSQEKAKVEARLAELYAQADSGFLSPAEGDEITGLENRLEIIDVNIEDLSKNERYSVAQANADMTDVFTETRNEYISVSLQDEFGDAVVKSEYKHVQDVVNHPDNKEAFKDFKNSSTGNTYKAMDDFATEAKTANTELSSDIYRAQTAKETISKSEAKKAADADRSAVGGHSGGKK